MKLLVVDDESYKHKGLMQFLKTVEGIDQAIITHVLDLNKAREELRNTYYDFMILDLNMPEVLGESTRRTAGADFIDEVIEVEIYKKPMQIIILTEFSESEIQFKEIKNRAGFTVLKYDITHGDWADVIISKIEYAILCEKQRGITDSICDVAIITAVEIESKAVKNISDLWKTKRIKGDPSYCFESTLSSDQKTIHIVHSQQSEMGMSAAATLSTKIINNYHPKYLIMVGIAAGIGSTYDFGDIIIPTEVWNYSSGKYFSSIDVDNNSELLKLAPDPKLIPLNPQVRDLIAQQDYASILFSIRQQFLGLKPKCELKIVKGPMACGGAVCSK